MRAETFQDEDQRQRADTKAKNAKKRYEDHTIVSHDSEWLAKWVAIPLSEASPLAMGALFAYHQ